MAHPEATLAGASDYRKILSRFLSPGSRRRFAPAATDQRGFAATSRRSVLERQPGVLFGDHRPGMLRSVEMIEFAQFYSGLETVAVGKDV